MHRTYDFSNMVKLLNDESVRKTLDVGDRKFVMKNFVVGIPALLQDGIKVLVYAGEYDLVCNWLCNWRWTKAMEWSGHRNFQMAPTTRFMVNGKEAGKKTSYGPLTFLKVHGAGHLVPIDQPKPTLEMLRRWMHH